MFAYIRRSVVGRLRRLRDMVLAAEDRQPVSVPLIIRDEIDDIGRAVGALVTTLAGRENTLRQSEEHLRLLVENAPFPLVVADRDSGFVTFANEQAQQSLFPACRNRDSAEPVQVFDMIADPAEQTRIRAAIAETARSGRRELRLRGKLGPFWAVLSVSPIQFQGQTSILFAVQDIDGLKAAEERLSLLVRDLERSNAIWSSSPPRHPMTCGTPCVWCQDIWPCSPGVWPPILTRNAMSISASRRTASAGWTI